MRDRPPRSDRCSRIRFHRAPPYHSIVNPRSALLSATAGRAGITSHSLILEAIAQEIEQDALRVEFESVADDRRYRCIAEMDTVFILAILGQQEAGYAKG